MRSIWTGTISFGLVSVPVKLYPATESKEPGFRVLHKRTAAPIGDEKVRKDAGEADLTRSIEIRELISFEEIDAISVGKGYDVLPQDGAERLFALFVRAFEETGKAGIANVAIRNKQHLAAIRPWQGKLLLETMDDAGPVRRPEPFDPARRDISPEELFRPDAEVIELTAALRKSVERGKTRSSGRKPAAKPKPGRRKTAPKAS